MPPEMLTQIKDEMHFIAVMCAITIVPAALIAGGTWWISQWLANRCLQDLREAFFRHYLHLPMGFHVSASKGDMITRMSSDMEASTDLARQLFGKLQQRPVEIAGIIITLFVIDWRLATLLFGILIPVFGLLLNLFKKTKKRAVKARTTNAANLTAFEQAATGIRVIKSTGNQDAEIERYGASTATLFHNEMKTAKSRSGCGRGELCARLSAAGGDYVGGHLDAR